MTAYRPRFPLAAAIRAKEWAQIIRDPSTIMLVVVLPLILMFLFGSAVSLDSLGTRTGLVDLDRSAASRDLVASLAANDHFALREAPALAPLEGQLMTGGLRAVIVIPDGFARGLLTGGSGQPRPVNLQIITDGSQPNTAAFVTGHARGVLATWLQARARAKGMVSAPALTPALVLLPHYNYNPGLESRYMLVPGAIAIVMAMIGTLLTALVMSREYERGTMEGLLSTRLSIAAMVFNKLIPYFLLGMASTGICVLVAVFAYGLPFHGSLLALMVISGAFLTASLGQGLLISAITKNQFVATQFALLSGFLPSLMLSGFLFEIDSMPRPIQWVTWVVPARYLIPSLQSLFLIGDVWHVFLPNIAVMLGFGVMFFLGVTRAISRQIA